MKFSAWFFRCALALLLCASLNGCEPTGQTTQQDEEKEPHFIEGMRALNLYDHEGAVDEFEKAVEANPHNASAHFELGCLYEGNRQAEEQDPKEDAAAAIYHYEQFLKLRSNAPNADFVKQRIINCKQDLAKAVLPLPTTPGVQRDLEQLLEENKQLRAQLDQWQAYVKALTNQIAMLQDHPHPPVLETQRPPAVVIATNPPPYTFRPDTHPPIHQPTTRVPVTYVVQSRDTMASISRKFNVKLDALALANPGINARKLRVGQTVNIP